MTETVESAELSDEYAGWVRPGGRHIPDWIGVPFARVDEPRDTITFHYDSARCWRTRVGSAHSVIEAHEHHVSYGMLGGGCVSLGIEHDLNRPGASGVFAVPTTYFSGTEAVETFKLAYDCGRDPQGHGEYKRSSYLVGASLNDFTGKVFEGYAGKQPPRNKIRIQFDKYGRILMNLSGRDELVEKFTTTIKTVDSGNKPEFGKPKPDPHKDVLSITWSAFNLQFTATEITAASNGHGVSAFGGTASDGRSFTVSAKA